MPSDTQKGLSKLTTADLRAAGVPLGDAIKIRSALDAVHGFGATRSSPVDAQSPGALYVWCVCWRRVWIAPVGVTTYESPQSLRQYSMSIIGRCPCGVSLDPAAILAYNHQVWDDEEPVTGGCCGPSFASTKPAAVCTALSHVRPNSCQLYSAIRENVCVRVWLAFYCTRSG